LRQANFDVVVIDAAIDPDYRAHIERESVDALCLGISVLTGPMIRGAVEIGTAMKRDHPRLPIIFGGWHPTLLPDETLSEPFVDIVVRGQGEVTLVEVAEALLAKRPLDMIPGVSWKNNGRRVHNLDRHVEPLDALPIPAFDLTDFDAYEKLSGARKIGYATSVGCPYACNYCTDMVFYNRRFNPYDTAQVVAELVELVRKYALSEIALLDSNFLVDVRRALAIAEGIAASGVRFRWTFQASTDLLCRMADDDVKLLARSGVSHIGFGVESGSPEVLRLMNKAHEHIPDMYEAARKCANAGIRVTYNLIFGFPGEEKNHRKQTLSVMADIAERFDNVSFSPNVFTPYPGIPIWPRLRELGMSQPESLVEWADVDLGGTSLPWLQGEPFETLQRGISYFLLDSQINKTRRKSRSRAYKFLLRLTRRPLLWRLRNYAFKWPVELAICVAQRWLTVRRSLLTGQALSHNLVRTR
jgi:anaerobic magnesium-protoporphyrin IX monomethyl ester cyclase